jgi:hypothetical protein
MRECKGIDPARTVRVSVWINKAAVQPTGIDTTVLSAYRGMVLI